MAHLAQWVLALPLPSCPTVRKLKSVTLILDIPNFVPIGSPMSQYSSDVSNSIIVLVHIVSISSFVVTLSTLTETLPKQVFAPFVTLYIKDSFPI